MPLDETSHYICLGMLSSLLLGRCTFDGTPINGRTLNRFLINGATLQHNSIVEYSCDSSYKLTGSKVLRCKDGRWNATTPSCKGIIIYAQHKKTRECYISNLRKRNKFKCLAVYFISIFHIFPSYIIVLDCMTTISNYITAFSEYMITYHH